MFEYSEGMFHLLFANQDDDYYSDNLIKMNFIPYLRYRLIDEDFRFIYIFRESYLNPSKGYAVQYVGSRSKAALLGKKFSGFFSNVHKKSSEPDYVIEQDELDKQELFKVIGDVLNTVRKAERSAVVIPLAIFHEYAASEQTQQMLEEMKKSNPKCAIILTTTVTAAENDAFFVSDSLRFTGEDMQGEKNCGVFWNKKIFPEVADALDKDKDSTEKTIFTYTELQRSFGSRMHVWNELSYDVLYNAVRYFFLRQTDTALVGCSAEAAAVIWAWYSNEVFRDKYRIAFTNNPHRLTKVILNDLSKPEIRLQINEIARLEDAAHTDAFLKRYQRFEETVYIRNISSTSELQKTFRLFCEASRGKMTGAAEERRCQLLKRSTLFTLPSFVSAYCLTEPPHLLVSVYRDTLFSLLENLKSQSSWDFWYTASALIITELLIMFTDVMKEKCSVDLGNQLSLMKLETAIDTAEYCIKMSARGGAEDEALDICENAVAVMRLSNAEFGKNYNRIKQELSAAKARNTQT